MPNSSNSFGKILIIILIGLLIGTALGSVIAKLLDPGWLKQVFLASLDLGKYVEPFITKVVKVFSEIFLRFNIMSIAGILVAYWFSKK